MKKSWLVVALSLCSGCYPLVEGNWVTYVSLPDQQRVVLGGLELSSDGERIEGTLRLEMDTSCRRLVGQIDGRYVNDRDEMNWQVEFEPWACAGYPSQMGTLDLYDVFITLDDGPWGSRLNGFGTGLGEPLLELDAYQ